MPEPTPIVGGGAQEQRRAAISESHCLPEPLAHIAAPSRNNHVERLGLNRTRILIHRLSAPTD